MWRTLVIATRTTLILGVLTCGIYPGIVTLIAQACFKDQAEGSLLRNSAGVVVGSRLIGQNFTQPQYFHGRPSGAGTGYDATSSSGSNLGPTNQKLADALHANVAATLKENPTLTLGQIPTDAVTASASGLDPHISPENALIQVARVAEARHVPRERIQDLVGRFTQGPQLGLLGDSVVNVLELNLALDSELKVQ